MGRIFNLPNIPKNDAEVQEKRGMFRFFELFFRKFVSYAKINLLFFGLSLPIAVIVLIVLHIGLPLCAYMFLGKLIPIALGIILVLEMFVLQSFSMFMINFNANSKLQEYMK